MNHSSTFSPPAAISTFPSSFEGTSTTYYYGVSLFEQQIQSRFESADKELSRYSSYPPSWDGYRAKAFEPEVLGLASAILRLAQQSFKEAGVVPSMVTTGPASDGSVDIELRAGDRRILFTLYSTDADLQLTWFQADEAHEARAPRRTAAVDAWLDWLRVPSAVPPIMASNRAHP